MSQVEGPQNKKEQLLQKFCKDREELKWERDSFQKKINRQDRCGECYLDKTFARKVASGEYWGS